jgi:hypothetical protein
MIIRLKILNETKRNTVEKFKDESLFQTWIWYFKDDIDLIIYEPNLI